MNLRFMYGGLWNGRICFSQFLEWGSEMVARVYALDGSFAGRLLYVIEYLPNGFVQCVILDMGGQSRHIIPMEMIEISVD